MFSDRVSHRLGLLHGGSARAASHCPLGIAHILIGIIACCAVVLLSPTATRAQGEAATVARMFKACTDSGGVAASSYNAWVAQNGCKCNGSSAGSGQVSCPSSATSTTSTAAATSNPMVTFVQTYQKAIEEARARDVAQRNAATNYYNGIAAGANQDAESREDQAQNEDLLKYRAKMASEEQAKQNSFANAHGSASDFLTQSLATTASMSDGSHGGAATQKAWKQLHCLAFVSRIAFENLALNDYTDFHDLAPEASKAFNGSAMDVSCPAVPLLDFRGKNNVDMSKVSNTLKDDLDKATQVAQRLEQYHLAQTSLPPLPPDVAADPKLAAAWKVQKALNAVDAQPNPGKTPEEFIQVQKDRDTIKKSLVDSNKAVNGDFGGIQVDLSPSGAASPSSSSSPGKSQP